MRAGGLKVLEELPQEEVRKLWELGLSRESNHGDAARECTTRVWSKVVARE